MLIYLGNQLASTGKNPTAVDTLGLQLEELMPVVRASNKTNIVLRLLHMWSVIFRNRSRANIVVIDTYSTLNFYYAVTCAFWCRIWKLPYITFLHGGKLADRFVSSPRLSKFLFGNAHKLISPSGYLAEAFQQYGYNVTVIPNNIEVDRYPFMKRSGVKPRLLYVRALDLLYNPSMAIKVLAQLRSETGEGELCFVGPDKNNSTPQLMELANSLGMAPYIRYTGKLSKEGWTSLSANYDIFINPTHADNMPVSVIESMALGLPVVSTNVGGLRYIINDRVTGLLVNDDDSVAMTRAIRELCSNPLLAADISVAGRLYAEQFDWKIVRQKWKQVLLGKRENTMATIKDL